MSKEYSQEYMMSLYVDDMEVMQTAQKINTEMRSRVDEIISFAKTANYKKIGIAHCVSFTRQAERLEQILREEFLVEKVNCKVGRLPKSRLLGDGYGSACNPILQAEVLNDEKTDLNVVLGLCVGHDMLFSKYSKAPSTTLLIKDEVYNNEPIRGF